MKVSQRGMSIKAQVRIDDEVKIEEVKRKENDARDDPGIECFFGGISHHELPGIHCP
jgi:hypothetical protein